MTDRPEDPTRVDFELQKRFLKFDDEDRERLRRVRGLVEGRSDELLDAFYEHILSFPRAAAFFQNERHLANIRAAQGRHFSELLEGPYDAAYRDSRLRVGRAHERIGLSPAWYLGAYGRYLALVVEMMAARHEGSVEELVPLLQSLVKVVTLDMSLAIDTYIEAREARERRLKDDFSAALTEYSDRLGEATAGISATIAEESASAQQQAASVAEITTTIAELRDSSRQALNKAESVARGAKDSEQVSREGRQAVDETREGMEEIRRQVKTIEDRIHELNGKSEKIGEIIQSVREIAEDSKVLALNAAIEAARAGEHGRGFSAVATEMRKLADDSRDFTGQVRDILNEIRRATQAAVLATEEGTRRVGTGVERVGHAGHNIRRLQETIDASAGEAGLIAVAAHQQKSAIEQVDEAMKEINEVTQANRAALAMLNEAAKGLRSLAAEMNALLARYSSPAERGVEYRHL